MTVDDALDAPHVHDVGADADDHVAIRARPRSIAARMV